MFTTQPAHKLPGHSVVILRLKLGQQWLAAYGGGALLVLIGIRGRHPG